MCTNLFGMIFFQPVEILNLETFHLPKSGFGSKRNAIARLAAGAMTVCAMAAAAAQRRRRQRRGGGRSAESAAAAR